MVKNIWLVICQVVLSLISMIAGVIMARIVFGNGGVTGLISFLFLFDLVFPFMWFSDITEERVGVDKYFAFGQVLWHVLFMCVMYKYGLFALDAVDLFVVAVVIASFFGLRLAVQDSFLKQER